MLNLKAEAFFKRSLISIGRSKDLECAFRSYMKAVELVEIMRNQYTPDEYNQGFESVSRETYGSGLKVSMELFRLTGDESYRITALKLSEKSKAALLWGMITNSEAKEFAGIPEKMLETESMLRNEIVRLELLLEREYLSGKKISLVRREALETAYFETRSRYQKFIDDMGRLYPRYFELRYRNRMPDITEIRSGLEHDEALIEYFMSDDRISIFLFTRDDFISREVPSGKDFRETVTGFYRSIVKIEESSFLRTSPVLYDSLIRPVAEYIKGRKKLIIIPDGELYLVPFEALISGSEGNIPFSGLDFLIRDHSFSYHYSIALRDSRAVNGERGQNRNFIGFAPVFKWKAGSVFEPVLRALPKLPGTAEEVRSIMELFSSKGIGNMGFFYSDATETKFKKVLKEQEFGFIHIATHTVNNIEKPALSGLIFAEDPEVPEDEDGVLFSKEIYNLKLRTPLLVLSSCESGAGKLVKGEGVLALNRGFLFAGAQNIIFSLWNVEDRSTSRLMVELYRKILDGNTFHDSLREAKLSLISDPYTAFPKYWSGFILFGE